ncbi:MAG: hypothetical protein CMM45_06600 [Rhodospirillaceae bacterium]|nr:hypothetical protein [Rhodospirillaceae bacterium]
MKFCDNVSSDRQADLECYAFISSTCASESETYDREGMALGSAEVLNHANPVKFYKIIWSYRFCNYRFSRL